MSTEAQAFLKEIQLLVKYVRWGWPLHRKFISVSQRCRNCVASEKLSPLKDGVCEVCRRPHSIAPEPPAGMETELKSLLGSYAGRGKGRYDALVLFSGGKDSILLVSKLRKEFPGVRLLCATVDNTFMSPIALQNIQWSVEKLGVAHLMVRLERRFFEKMYRSAFLRLEGRGTAQVVDQFDGDLIHDVGRNLASEFKIPLLLSGVSRTQVRRILNLASFESPFSVEKEKRTTVAGIPLAEIFDAQEMKAWWDGAAARDEDRPRVVFPFYVWDYPEERIREILQGEKLMGAGMDHPILTNNRLIPLMSLVDMVTLGYSSFEPEFAERAREGKIDRDFWRGLFEITEYAAKSGKFIADSVDQVLARLSLTRSQVGLKE